MSAGHIKQVGDYPVNIALHTDVIANITVSVLGEHKS
jgi:large subunit ribosomal protein L9